MVTAPYPNAINPAKQAARRVFSGFDIMVISLISIRVVLSELCASQRDILPLSFSNEENHGPDEIRTHCLSAERSPHPSSPRGKDRPHDGRLPAGAEATQHDRASEVSVDH